MNVTHRDARSSITPEVRALLKRKFAAEVDLYEYALSLHRHQMDLVHSVNLMNPQLFQSEDEYIVETPPDQIQIVPFVGVKKEGRLFAIDHHLWETIRTRIQKKKVDFITG